MSIAITLPSATPAEWQELSEILIHYTYKIEGASAIPGKNTCGTIFLVGKPFPGNTNDEGQTVMVTAAHVLNDIVAEKATVIFRKHERANKYSRIAIDIPIRNSEKKPLWVQHPEVDVAAMYINVPPFIPAQAKDVPVPSTVFFATDKTFDRYKIHSGEKLFCLGFPYGAEANAMGFPILRSGTIASFPLTPAKDLKSFLFDFEVFGGNSGGPVLFMDAQRRYGLKFSTDIIQFIVGLVSEEKYGIEQTLKPIEVSRTRSRYEIEETKERLGLAIVIPAVFIQETIDLLDKASNNKQ